MSSSALNPPFLQNRDARQCVAAAHLAIAMADFVKFGNVIDLQMPDGAQVVGGDIVVTDTFDTTGTDTLAIGTDDSAARYLAATSLKAAARTAVTPTGYQHSPTHNVVRLTRTPADAAATKGTVWVTIHYVVADKAEWTQG